MLTEFRLQNFKALADATFQLGKINVFVGPNSSGKSSVLQALAVLKQSLDSENIQPSGELVELGTLNDLVFKKDRRKNVHLRILATSKIRYIDVDNVGYDYSINFDSDRFTGHILEIQSEIVGTINSSLNLTTGKEEITPALLPLGGATVSLRVMPKVSRPIWAVGWSAPSSEWLGQPHSSYIEDLVYGISRRLLYTYVVPPMRGFDRVSYPITEAPTDDFFADRRIDSQAAAVLSTILYRRDLEDAISALSEKTLGVRLRVTAVPPKMVAAEAVSGNRFSANLVNEGFGVNQLMILLAQMVAVPEDSLLCIEEPEIHLHPKAQSALAGVFTEVATKQNKQIIITTHSEHILMNLLTQVACGNLSQDDLRVYYFEKDEEGISRPQLLEVNEHGQLKGGLRGFFEANLDQLDNYLEATSKRKRK